MKEATKNIGWTGLGILFIAAMLGVFVIFVRGSVWAAGNLIDWVPIINGFVFLVVVALLFLSFFPRMRIFTGVGIVYATTIWGFLLWLVCLLITYESAGFLGVFIGLMLAGAGIFLTAIGSLLFGGQVYAGVIIILNLVFIFAIRMLGVWIATKYRGQDNPISQSGSI